MNEVNQSISSVHVYENHMDAENAIRSLGHAGIDMRHLSLIGKGYHSEEHPIGFYTKGEKIRSWGKIGAFWGAIWGLLFAPAIFMFPGIGVLAMAGPIVTIVVNSIEGALLLGGVSALTAAMMDLGMGSDEAIRYQTAIKADQFLLIIHGTQDEIQIATNILTGPIKQLPYEAVMVKS